MSDTNQASDFDPELFMQQNVDQPFETERSLVSPGQYTMSIDDFDPKKSIEQFNFEYKQGPQAGQPGSMTTFNCPCVIQDDAVKAAMGQDKVVVFRKMILDIKNGQLEWGKNKNIALGQLRKAVRQNFQPGELWNIGMLRSAGPFVGQVEKTEFKRKDGTKGEGREVTRVAPLTT